MDQVEKPKVGAKDFFLHLGAIVGLYWSSISFIQLVTEIVNYRFPDAVSSYSYSYGYYTGTMRYAIASLIIVFPLFMLLSWLNQREIEHFPPKKEIWIRKWLLMITLFVAGITVVIDLVVFLNTFLGGEITTRFVLKALTVLLTALVIFGYYIWELRTAETRSSKRKAFAVISGLAVIVALVCGFMTVGSPATARQLKFDEQRVNDLQNIQYQIINYWQSKGKLPVVLSELEDSISGWNLPQDPQTGTAYMYSIKQGLNFELCATFNLKSSGSMGQYPSRPVINTEYFEPSQDSWTHDAGNVCFQRKIDPEFYPVRPK